MVVRGSASFRLAAKLKELKQNMKSWNRDVFGRLECNKISALQQGIFGTWWKARETCQRRKHN